MGAPVALASLAIRLRRRWDLRARAAPFALLRHPHESTKSNQIKTKQIKSKNQNKSNKFKTRA
jgi:hypothetical protein